MSTIIDQPDSGGVAGRKGVRLLAVIVLYKMRAADSPSLRTLVAAAKEVDPALLDLEIYIQDNTPGASCVGPLPEAGVARYEAAPNNPGLAHAYNRATEHAVLDGYQWLLTLDQDTTLPRDYLARMVDYIQRLNSSQEICAIVPQVLDRAKNLSPFWFMGGALPSWFKIGFTGVARHCTYALNSGAVLRVAALQRIGGYSSRFPLDVSDINLFHQLHASGGRVYVAGDIQVSHNFSLLDKARRMSLDRYRSMLRDECAFWDLYMSPAARMERFARLVARMVKDFLNSADAVFHRVTFGELLRRVSKSRAQRLKEWGKWADERSRIGE